MTLYVDDMFMHRIGAFRGMRMSHMIADTEAELHAMADKLGLKRQWYQGDHYDVSYSKRQEAIAAGARAVSLRELSRMCQARGRDPNATLIPPEFEGLI